MPQVIHNFLGDNQNPTLKLPKSERELLDKASWLCMAISMASDGHNQALSTDTRVLAADLLKLSVLEAHDLSKPV